MGRKWIVSLFCLGLVALSVPGETALISFQTEPFQMARENAEAQLFSGLVIYDDQSFSIHINDEDQVESAKVESFLILKPEAMKSNIIRKNEKLCNQDIFAVKILQEFNFLESETRVLRYTFFDSAGKIIEEMSFDNGQWWPIYASNPKYVSLYVQEMDERVRKALSTHERDDFLRY